MPSRRALHATTPVLRAGGVRHAWAGVGRAAQADVLSNADAASGIRAALERGATAAVELLGRPDGFLGNPKVRIPLPGFLNEAAKVLKFTGQQKRVDELVTAMNRAAEAAVPEAKALLVSAVKSMSVGDARAIVAGGQDSVTRFFAAKTRAPLGERFLPIVKRETARVDLAARFNAVAGKAAGMGLVKGDDANIERYVTGKALDGLYLMIGEEERRSAAIRSAPAARSSPRSSAARPAGRRAAPSPAAPPRGQRSAGLTVLATARTSAPPAASWRRRRGRCAPSARRWFPTSRRSSPARGSR